MKTKLFSLITAAAVICSGLPGWTSEVYAEAVHAIQISAIAKKKPGEKVDIQGTVAHPFKDVSVRVLDVNNHVLYFDIVPVINGQYNVSFNLPSTSTSGIYSVTVGQGSVVQVGTFEVEASQPGGLVGGVPSFPTIPMIPPLEVAKPVAPVDNKPGTNKSIEIQAPVDVLKAASKQEAGKKVIEAQADKVKLNQYITDTMQALKQQGNVDTSRKVFVLEVNGQGDTVRLGLTLDTFNNLEKQQSSAALQVQTELGSLVIPAKALNSRATALGLTGDAALTVNVAAVDTATRSSITELFQGKGATNLVTPVEFTIEAVVQGQRVELNQFDQYIEHTLTLPSKLSEDQYKYMAGVVVDPVTNSYYPMPTWFKKKGDGFVEGAILRKGNSVYTIVRNDKTFSDLTKSYAKETIEWLANRFIVDGYGDGTFLPERQVTRAEFAALLVRGLGIQPKAVTATSFTDVKATDWHAGIIEAAIQAGLVKGYGDGQFLPNQKVSRQEMVQMIYNAMKMAGYDGTLTAAERDRLLNTFKDKEMIPAWAREAVAVSIKEKIVNGMGDQSFTPGGNADRAQGSTVLYRMMKALQFIN